MVNDNAYVYNVAVGKMKEKAISLHFQRYVEVGFFKEGEMDPYKEKSLYFAVQPNESSEVVGVTRLIFDKLEDLPTMKHFQIYDIEKARIDQLDVKRYAELSAFTKLPGHDVGLGLIRSAIQYSLEVGITLWVCCLDERVFNYLDRIFKNPFRIIGEAQVYLGSKTIPCTMNLEEVLPNLKKVRTPLYDFLVTPQSRYLEAAIND
jgi:hypothetical protein